MTNVIQQDVSVLSAAKNGLLYLTPNDWTLIADKAARVGFKRGETIVHGGRPTDGVYFLLKGSAKVLLPGQTRFPAIGTGEV
jgi:signal-transduction protein with cAMP-binding, CBS, and nucleotidyltransferase domain